MLERGGRDWVPLLLDYAAVGRRLHGDLDAEGEEEEEEPGAAAAEAPGQQETEAGGAAPQGAAATAGAPAQERVEAVGGKRRRAAEGGGGGIGVGAKAWRQQMLEWLGLLAAVKGARVAMGKEDAE